MVFLIFVAAVAISAELAGNQKLSSGTEALFDSDEGIGADVATMVRNVKYPASNFVMDLNNIIVVPLLQSLTTTISNTLNLPASVNTVYCIRDSLLSMSSFTSFDTLVADMKDQFTGPGGLTDYISAADAELTTLEGQLVSFETQVTNMESVRTSTWFPEDEDIFNAAVLAQAAYPDYAGYCNEFGVDASGAVQTLASYLEQLETPNYPDATTFQAIAGDAGTPTPLYELATGGTYTPADLLTLHSDLAALHTTLDGIDLSGVSALLTSLENDIAAAAPNFASVASTANDLNTFLTSSGVNIHTAREQYFIDFCTEASNVTPSAFIGSIQDVETAIGNLDLNPVRNMLNDAYTVLDVIPCVDDTILLINNVSDDIIEVPAEIANLVNDITDFKDNIETIEDVIESGLETLDATQDKLDTMATSLDNQYTAAMQDMEDRLAEFSTMCTPNQFNDWLLNAQNVKTTPTAIANTYTNANSLQTYLTGFTSNFESFNQNDFGPYLTFFSDATTKLLAVTDEMYTFARGQCSVSTGLCFADGDCPGGETCENVGVPRCYERTTSTISRTLCTVDSDCTGAEVCLGDATRMATFRSLLSSLETPLDVSAPMTDLDDLQTHFDSTLGTTNSFYSNDLNSLLLGYGISGQVLQDILSNASNEIGQFPIGDIKTLLDDVTNEINNFDFTQLEHDAAEFSNTVNNILTQDVLDQINNAVAFMVALNDALFTYIPAKISLLTPAYLKNIDNTRGLYGLVEEVATAWLDVYDSVKQSLEDDGFDLIDLPNIDIMHYIHDYGKYADRLYSVGDYTDTAADAGNGALNYLIHLFIEDPADKFITSDYVGVYSVLTDINGQRYPGDRYCILSQCLKRTIETLNSKKMEDWISILPDFPSMSYYPLLSREGWFSLPLVFPFLVVLFGLLGLIAPCFAKTAIGGCCDNPRRQKIPIGCMLGNMICQLPLMFLLSGVLFSLSLTTMDVCATGTNIGANFIATNQDRLCAISKGTGTWEHCEFSTSFDLPSPNNSATETIEVEGFVNFPKFYKHLMGGCDDPDDPAQNEILRLLNTASTQVRDSLDIAADFYIGSASGSTPSTAGINLRAPIRQLAISTIDSAGNVVGNLLDRLGESEGPLGCDVVHEALYDALDAVCCGVVVPFWWYASAWFLIAWAYLLCGIPAGCKARKRLPTRVWGPGLHALLEREEGKKNKAVFLANREAVHEYLRFRKHTDFDYSLLDAESVSRESMSSSGRTDNPLSGHGQIEIPVLSISKRSNFQSSLTAPASQPDNRNFYPRDDTSPISGAAQPAFTTPAPYTVPRHEPVRISDVPPHLRNEI